MAAGVVTQNLKMRQEVLDLRSPEAKVRTNGMGQNEHGTVRPTLQAIEQPCIANGRERHRSVLFVLFVLVFVVVVRILRLWRSQKAETKFVGAAEILFWHFEIAERYGIQMAGDLRYFRQYFGKM